MPSLHFISGMQSFMLLWAMNGASCMSILMGRWQATANTLPSRPLMAVRECILCLNRASCMTFQYSSAMSRLGMFVCSSKLESSICRLVPIDRDGWTSLHWEVLEDRSTNVIPPGWQDPLPVGAEVQIRIAQVSSMQARTAAQTPHPSAFPCANSSMNAQVSPCIASWKVFSKLHVMSPA